jgi:hypothetical protein
LLAFGIVATEHIQADEEKREDDAEWLVHCRSRHCGAQQACFEALQEPVSTREFDQHCAAASGLQVESIRQCRNRLGNEVVRVEKGWVVPKRSVAEEMEDG